jgi:hypothetical protein
MAAKIGEAMQSAFESAAGLKSDLFFRMCGCQGARVV